MNIVYISQFYFTLFIFSLGCVAEGATRIEIYVRSQQSSNNIFETSAEDLAVEYAYQLKSIYLPKNDSEETLFFGIAEMETFAEPKAVHPWVGRPVYIAVVSDGKQVGKTILFYAGASVGFYLLDTVFRDESGLSGELDYDYAYPISSKPFVTF